MGCTLSMVFPSIKHYNVLTKCFYLEMYSENDQMWNIAIYGVGVTLWHVTFYKKQWASLSFYYWNATAYRFNLISYFPTLIHTRTSYEEKCPKKYVVVKIVNIGQFCLLGVTPTHKKCYDGNSVTHIQYIYYSQG